MNGPHENLEVGAGASMGDSAVEEELEESEELPIIIDTIRTDGIRPIEGRGPASVGEGAGVGTSDDPDAIATDPGSTINSSNSKKTKGSLAFYCPKYMIENTACNISLVISKDSLMKVVKLLTGRIQNANAERSAEEIEKDIQSHQIDVYEKMKVELKFDKNDFDLLSEPQNLSMIFDESNHQHEWDWVVKPKRPGSMQIILVVSAYNEKGGKWIEVESPPRIFNVAVKVDPRGYFVKLWGFLGANPEWLFVQVLFPIVAYFAGKRQGKKRK
ncbi:MAG: hypothetical protein MUF75_03300 [Bacteroidia bacterium]|jgi:hypothetical protein|nr:hypothetical protein [Bacteroidia bacterium]